MTVDRIMRPLPGEANDDGWDEYGPGEWEALAGHLGDVHELLTRHVAFPSTHAADAVTAWVVHAHLVRLGTFDSTPRLAPLSPEKGSGKTRLLEVLDLLVPYPMHMVNTSAAAMFRVVEKHQPTLLMDECDTYLGPRVSKEHEDVRGLVNAGHRRGAKAVRCVGEGGKIEVKEFSAFCAVVLAGIGDLPDTVMQRSIIISMKRRRPDEVVRPFRARKVEPVGHGIRDRLDVWVQAHAKRVDDLDVVMPTGVTDRPADVWEPLVIIGDAAGHDWSERIRSACSALTAANVEHDASLGVRLLGDIQRVFDGDDLPELGEDDRPNPERIAVDKMHTANLLVRLNGLDDAPWGDLRGKELDARRLSKMLRQYEVRPTDQRIDGTNKKGYDRTDFYDSWQRYLPRLDPPSPSDSTATSATSATGIAHVALVADNLGRNGDAS